MIKYRILKNKSGQSLSLNPEHTKSLVESLQGAVANEVGIYMNFYGDHTDDTQGAIKINLKAPSEHPKGKISEFVNYKLTNDGSGISLSASSTESLLVKVVAGQSSGVFINMYGKKSKFSDGFLTVNEKKESKRIVLPLNTIKDKKVKSSVPTKSKAISE